MNGAETEKRTCIQSTNFHDTAFSAKRTSKNQKRKPKNKMTAKKRRTQLMPPNRIGDKKKGARVDRKGKRVGNETGKKKERKKEKVNRKSTTIKMEKSKKGG